MKRIKLKLTAWRSLERAEKFNNPQLKRKAIEVISSLKRKNAKDIGLRL